MERLTRQEAAEFLGCSLSAFYSLEKCGQLEGTYDRIGKRKLYIKSKIEKWALDEGCKITADLDSLRVDGPFTLYACWIKE